MTELLGQIRKGDTGLSELLEKIDFGILTLLGPFIIAAGLKAILLVAGTVPFNSDEAVVALMARHILQGARPTFFYGQAYMGSLDAYLVAGSFLLFGEKVSSIRLVQIALYLLYMLTLWILARRFFADRSAANLVLWIAAIPTVLVTTYTTATLGGYGESLVLGNLILWLGYEVIFGNWQDSSLAWLILGLTGGLAFWTLGMAGVYLLPVAILGLRRFNYRKIQVHVLAAIGFFAASSPWWIYNFNHSGEALAILTGTSSLSLTSSTPFQRLIGFFLLGIPTLLGFRFPWSAEYAPWLVVLFTLIFYFGVDLYNWKRVKDKARVMQPGAYWLLSLFSLIFLLVFLGTQFGIDATGRYFLPLYVPLTLASAALIHAAWKKRTVLGVGLLVLLLSINLFETGRAASSTDKITTQFDPITRFDNAHDGDLVQFLRQHGETRGYSNYWVSFRLAFLSQEEIIYAPLLPYKADLSYSPADNRYPIYGDIVARSSKVAFITTKNPNLNDQIREGFKRIDINYSENVIGDFHIFYQLSHAVSPGEIGLEASIQ
jgi:4-amino-4-deoxy-L-arabinose transferase-like glycosyltransferase